MTKNYEPSQTDVSSLSKKSEVVGSSGNPQTMGETACSTSTQFDGKSCATVQTKEYKKTSGDVPYSYALSQGKNDRRVSLTVAPKVTSSQQSQFADRVAYLLGSEKSYFPKMLKNGEISNDTQKWFYGFLRNCLGKTSGLIFPYTPRISFTHNVNYEQTDIMHTNLSIESYKNTPPPAIQLTAKFTADNRTNAVNMLSAIWFFTAMTKCEFGDYNRSCVDTKPLGGLPPPPLYLNGYNNLIDNVPVIINNFNYTYPDDKDYVNVVMNLTQKDNYFQVEYVTENTDYKKSVGSNVTTPGNIKVLGNRASDNNSAILSVWLPTEITIGMNLRVQPNLLKTRKQWSLSDYKSAALMLESRKNFTPKQSSITRLVVDESGSVKEKTEIQNNDYNFIPSGWTW